MAITSREGLRETEALEVLARTQITPPARGLLLAAFVVLLSFVAVTQPFVRRPSPVARSASPAPSPIDAAAPAPDKKPAKGLWQRLVSPPEAETLRRFERKLEERTAVGAWIRPAVQRLLLRFARQGSANVVKGRENWLFYRKDVEHVMGHPFLDPDRLHLRRRVDPEEGQIEPDPVKALIAFARRLDDRSIRLIVAPVPVKPAVYPEHLASDAQAGIDNASYPELLSRLRAENVTVVDLLPALTHAKQAGRELYRQRDTHWNGYGIDVAGERLAPEIQPFLGVLPRKNFTTRIVTLPMAGDMDGLLKLPAPLEEVPCREVSDAAGQRFEPKRGAPVVLLGDSFSQMCTASGIGGGLGAVLASQLGVDVDVVASTGGGSRDSRVAFEAQPERFANARVVVWEFVTRALTFGNWR